MKPKTSHQCFGCKEVFRDEELIQYTPPGREKMHRYCKKCYENKLARERFTEKVCSLFGLKKPGPKLWTQRERIINEYGYTDDTIIACLDYIYNVKKNVKKMPTLYYVTPPMVDEMRQYMRAEEAKGMALAQATLQEKYNHIVPIKENETNQKQIYDPDEWLGD